MFQVPAIVQILVIFALVVAATAFRVHLGLAASIGGILLAAWRGMEVPGIASAAFREITSADTLLLSGLMICILAFSSAMTKAGEMTRFAEAVEKIAPSRRLAMAIAPMLIGSLPMPGGAILSAPLVKSMNSSEHRSAGSLSAANYWFRHSFELMWPLNPAFILTTSITGLTTLRLMSLNLFAFPLLFILGLVFILPEEARQVEHHNKVNKWGLTPFVNFIVGIAPLAIVIGSYVVFDIAWKLLSPFLAIPPAPLGLIGRYAPILLGLSAGSFALARRAGGFHPFKGSVNKGTINLVTVILGIRIFSILIVKAGVAGSAATELMTAGIPSVMAIAFIPFIAGLVTGVGFGYVGLALPIVLGLLPAGGAFPREAGIVLAGAFGYAGMMFSPLHVCMVVSAEHFKTGLPATIRSFALPLGIFVAGAAGYVAILAGFMLARA